MSEQLYWDKKYETGIEKIDLQHRQLFDYLERLRQSLKYGLDNPIVGQTIKDLVLYTQKHFTDEEEIQKQLNFKEYEKHKEMHQMLIKELTDILLKIKNSEPFDANDLYSFLSRWIKNHIIKEDLKIGESYEQHLQKQIQ